MISCFHCRHRLDNIDGLRMNIQRIDHGVNLGAQFHATRSLREVYSARYNAKLRI